MSGNKHDNGVHEVGKPETRKAYQEDTPGQQVEKYLESINEVIEEKKEKQKKSFMKVFQNPLKGFPYNEELDDNFVKSLDEGKYAKYSDLLMKKAKEMQAIDKAQNKSGVASPSLNALKSINKEIEKEMKKLGITESINDDLEEGKMGELFLDIQNGATAKDIARDYPVSIQQAKDFLKDYYSQKKKPLKMGEETEILRNYDSLLEAKDLMPAIKKIVDTKGAAKVGGVMLDMFTASMILTVYDKVNDQNKGRMEKSNIQTLVHIAHKVMGVKEETVSEAMKIKDIFKKHKRELNKAYKTGDLSFSGSAGKKAEDDLTTWALNNNEIKSDDPDEFFDWLSRDLEDIVKGKIKEDVSEKFSPYTDKTYSRCVDFYIQFRGGKGDRITSEENKKDYETAKKMIDTYCRTNKIKQKPVYSTPEEGSSAYKVGLMIDKTYSKTDDYDKGVDLQPLYVALSKLKTAEDHGGGWDKATPSNSRRLKGAVIGEDEAEEGKIKYRGNLKGLREQTIAEGTWALPKTSKQKKELKDLLKKPVILGKDGDDASDKLYDLIGDDGLFDDLYKAGQKNPKGDARPIIKAKMKELGIKEGKMDGGKLTGQEISVYFRRNKVRDKQTRKAVEIALDHGGAMSYAIKQIEKLKKGLSKDKDVEKALNYANFGESVRVNEVGFQFREDSPIAGNIQVEGDPYIPQKKGVNKNIANYWNKEIKGLKPKELEAIQSMYMITDHSGVVQMYKAGKRDFIKSIKS